MEEQRPPGGKPAASLEPKGGGETRRSDPPGRGAGPPDSFARIFLEGLDRYRAKGAGPRGGGSATEEAAANIAQRTQRNHAFGGFELRSPRAVVETVVITAAVPVIGWVVDRSDPFFLRHQCAWLLFAPLLVALRHGFALGFTSAVLLDVALVTAWRTKVGGFVGFPGEPLVALLVLAMIAGQFSDVWKREIVRLDNGFEVLKKQLHELERSHFLLDLSHDRLDAQVGRGVNSLREAMAAVREIGLDSPEPPTYGAIGDAIMEVLAAYCMLEVGELCVVDKAGALGARVASLGRASKIDPRDPLLERALRKGKLTYVPAASNPDRDPQLARSPLLAVVPFVSSAGVTNAVLCVQAMPFIAFERKNLEAMATLAGHFADLVTFGGESSSIERGRKELFQVRVQRALRDQKEREIPSVIAALWIKRAAPVSDLVDVLLGGALRELEFPYVARDRSDNYLVYVLLPMADETAARALEQRFEAIVRAKLNQTISAAGALFFWRLLAPTDTVPGLFRLFEEKAAIDGSTLGSGGRLR